MIYRIYIIYVVTVYSCGNEEKNLNFKKGKAIGC
jgi:hypothetical protein